jgi:hypothetical protein
VVQEAPVDLVVNYLLLTSHAMGRKPVAEKKKLKYLVTTRVTNEKYQELKKIADSPPHYPMSELIRRILDNRRIKLFISDPTMEPDLEELRTIREKIKLTGILINQHTKAFNSHPNQAEKEFYAKLAFMQYTSLEPHFDRLLEIVNEAAKRWLDDDSSKLR